MHASPESDLLLVEATEWGPTDATIRSVTESLLTGLLAPWYY